MNMARAFLSTLGPLLLCLTVAHGRPNSQQTASDTEIDRLIKDLPSEKAKSSTMISFETCDIFAPWSDSESDSPAHKLAAIRFKAVPKLIAALSDRRATKCALSLKVGDVALQVIEKISARQFTSMHGAMKEGEIPMMAKEVSTWWADAQKIGELAALTKELNSPGNQQAAVAIGERFPTETTRIMRDALHSKNPGLMRVQCDYALAVSHDPAAKAVLREEAESGPDVKSRVVALRYFLISDSKLATTLYVKEWKRFSDPPAIRKPGMEAWPFTRADFIEPMLFSGDPTALKCLVENLQSRSAGFRGRLVWAIFSQRTSHDRATIATIERMLAGELDDTGKGASGGIGGDDGTFSFESPEIGDLAALAISLTNPSRYH